MKDRRRRVALAVSMVAVPIAWSALLWASWFFDGCRGSSYRGGGCGDFDAIESYFRLALLVLAAGIAACVGAFVMAAGRLRDWAVEQRRRDSYAALYERTS